MHNAVMLADDDLDDCAFFAEILGELPGISKLETVHDGVALMKTLLQKNYDLPDVLFLDLNMPKKNGYDCLLEIKRHKELQHLPVIIFSTSLDYELLDLLYANGAYYYLRKPGEFLKLRQAIHQVITTVLKPGSKQPAKASFVISV